MSVAYDRVRDAAHKRPPYAPKPAASYHYQAGSQPLGQIYNLGVRVTRLRVSTRDLATLSPYPWNLPIDLGLGRLHGRFLQPVRQIFTVEGLPLRGRRHVGGGFDVYEVQLRAGVPGARSVAVCKARSASS